jgi:hypothetical protein
MTETLFDGRENKERTFTFGKLAQMDTKRVIRSLFSVGDRICTIQRGNLL